MSADAIAHTANVISHSIAIILGSGIGFAIGAARKMCTARVAVALWTLQSVTVLAFAWAVL